MREACAGFEHTGPHDKTGGTAADPAGLGAAWLLRGYFPDARTDYEARQLGPAVDVILGASFVKGLPVLPPGTCPA